MKVLPEAADNEKIAFKAARKGLKALTEQPAWLKGTQLYPHQLQVYQLLKHVSFLVIERLAIINTS